MSAEQTELPIRVYDQPGGAIIRCLCGLELAQMRKRLAGSVPGLAHGRGNPLVMGLSPDITSAGLLAMVNHAARCERGRAILAAQWAVRA